MTSDAAGILLPRTPDAPRWLSAWGYLKAELLYVSWALMETAVIVPFGLIFMPWARYWPTGQVTLWVFVSILLAFNLIRFMSALQLSAKQQRRVLLVGLLLSIFLAWRLLLFGERPLLDASWLGDLFAPLTPEGASKWSRTLVIFMLVVISWWRGIRLVSINPDIGHVGLRLRTGAIIFGFLALLSDALRTTWSVMPFILLYYLTGLTSAALIRADEIEKEHSGQNASVSPRWVGTIFMTSLLVVGVGGLLAGIISGETVFQLVDWFSPLWGALLALVGVVLATLAYLGQPLISLITLLIELLSRLFGSLFTAFAYVVGEDFVPDLDVFAPPATPEAGDGIQSVQVPFVDGRIILAIIMGLIVLIVVFALTRLYREATLAARDSRYGRAGVSTGARPANLGQRILQQLGLLRNWRTAASIRRIYQQMSEAAAGAGFPRAASETPFEYLPTLAQVWPEHPGDSYLITQAYVRVRYGEIPETEAELDEIKAAWKRLERARPVRLED